MFSLLIKLASSPRFCFLYETGTDSYPSRLDAYFGDNHDFDEHTFDQTKSYFLAEEITLQQAANARLARMYTSNATNPTFNLSDTGVLFSFGETAAYLLVFGNAEGTSASRELVEYFFGK